MNKRDLARAVAVHADTNVKTVSAVLEGFTDVVTAVVAHGEPVAIGGFAKFAKVSRAARMGRNPATGEAIRIKASKKVRITPVKAFKDAVMSRGSAPKLKRGAYPTSDDAVRTAGAPRLSAPARKAAAPAAPARRRTAARAAAPRRRSATGAAAPARRTAATRTTARGQRTTVTRTAPPAKQTAKARTASVRTARSAQRTTTAHKPVAAKPAARTRRGTGTGRTRGRR